MLSFTTILLISQISAIDLTASIGPSIGRGSGREFNTVTNNTKTALLFNAGGNFFNFGLAAVGWELPVATGGPERSIVSMGVLGARTYSAKTNLIFTPGVRLRIVPASPVTPWVSVGYGFGRVKIGGAENETGYLPTLSVAGGMDFKLLPFLLLRGEVRNYRFSNLDIPFAGNRVNIPVQSNLMFMFGAGLRF